MNNCENLFDILKVKNYSSHADVKEDLEKYVDLAKKSKNLSADIKLEEIEKQYDLFIERVKKNVDEFKFNPSTKKDNTVKIKYPERVNQLELYKKMYNTQSLYKDIEPIMHLSLTANCRTQCEAVVEGMGSVLTANNEQRGNLSNEALEREAFIRWQGPEPSSQNATIFIEKAMDRHFNGRNKWNFTSQSETYTVSKVVQRKKEEAKKMRK